MASPYQASAEVFVVKVSGPVEARDGLQGRGPEAQAVVGYKVEGRHREHEVVQTLRPETIREIDGAKVSFFEAVWKGWHWHLIERVSESRWQRSESAEQWVRN